MIFIIFIVSSYSSKKVSFGQRHCITTHRGRGNIQCAQLAELQAKGMVACVAAGARRLTLCWGGAGLVGGSFHVWAGDKSDQDQYIVHTPAPPMSVCVFVRYGDNL